MNFLQDHYNKYRQTGGDHGSYVVWNDLEVETGDHLLKTYNEMYPNDVPQEVKDAYHRNFLRENERLTAIDDLEWLSGTGRYGQ